MDPTRLVCDAYMRNHPVEAARLLEAVPAQEMHSLLARCDGEAATRTLEQMSADRAAAGIEGLGALAGAPLLEAMNADVQLAILRLLTPRTREGLLGALPSEIAGPLRRLLRYPAETVGGLMDAFVFTLTDDLTVQEALERATTATVRVPFYIYVVDRSQMLVGVVSMNRLIHATRDAMVAALMEREVLSLDAALSRAEMVKSPSWREYHSLPVVDEDGIFQGVLRYETLARVRSEVVREAESEGVLDTALALGELYWIGLSGVMDGIAGRPRETTGEGRTRAAGR